MNTWRHYDGMTWRQRQLYRLGFGSFTWFRRGVGGRWLLRYWLPTPHSSEGVKERWEYHPNSTFVGCLDTIEYWEEPATARALITTNASIFSRLKVFAFSCFRVGVLRRLTGHGRTRRTIPGRDDGDAPLLGPDAGTEAGRSLLAGADGPALLRRPEAREVYARRHDALGEFLQAYEEYLEGKKSYEEIKAMKIS